ncbi:MAG: adenosine deaminase family protein [Candidatus Gastranaerophilales bacterium]|nr:adenosine deaminase family protein [Candidatus Gastranaerophilales bacterium]
MPTLTPDIKALFRAIPKAELHVHLAGAYPMYKMREFFREKGISEYQIARATSVQDLYNDLTDFVKFYLSIAELVQEEGKLEEVTQAVCLKAAEDNVKYLELKLAGCELAPVATQTPEERQELREKMYRAIKKGVSAAREKLAEKGFKQVVKYIYTAERHNPSDVSFEEAKQAVKWAKEHDGDFVGFDLAGDEINFSVNQHKQSLDYVRENGLKITCHAGETSRSENMSATEAIFRTIELGATRIGHGLYACESEELIKTLRDNHIAIEVSPSSNIATLSVPSWDEHPIKKMFANDIPVTICSDDPAMFNTKISKEYEQLYKHGILTDWGKIRETVLNGIRYAFCDEKTKAELLQDFEDELKLIEESGYFKRTIDRYLSGK